MASGNHFVNWVKIGPAALLAVSPISAWAVVNVGSVLPLALDQPQLNVVLSNNGNASNALNYDDGLSGAAQAFPVFADTGASGVLLDGVQLNYFNQPASQISLAVAGGSVVKFFDVGVGGTQAFDVALPVYVHTASNFAADPNTGEIPLWAFNLPANQVSMQLSDPDANPLSLLGSTLNVFGMPMLAGKVLKVDNSALNPIASSLGALLGSGLFDPSSLPAGTDIAVHTSLHAVNDPAVQETSDFRVKLSYASFDAYTHTDPANYPDGPTLSANPFVGWNPIAGKQAGDPAGVTVSNGGASAEGSFLLDTGAAVSMISTQTAQSLGVFTDPATGMLYRDAALTQGVTGQFTTTIGGVGGTKTIYGFYLGTLDLPATDSQNQSDTIRFSNVPVYVNDISLQMPGGGPVLTLDGILGMNLLNPSADLGSTDLGAGLNPLQFVNDYLAAIDAIANNTSDPIEALTKLLEILSDPTISSLNNDIFANFVSQASPFSSFLVDNQNGYLELNLVPEPTGAAILTLAGAGCLIRRRR